MLRITARTAAAWRKDGTLPHSKVNGKIFYRLSDIEKMMEKRAPKPEPVM
jgi:predicted site-specific integrase-resolvase